MRKRNPRYDPSSWNSWERFDQFQVTHGVCQYISLPRLRYLIRCDSGTSLPFHLLVETFNEILRYTPKSDFHMCIKDFPHLLLEVSSQSNESDKIRMLLQASCVSRIGNWLRASSNIPIVIMAVYVDKDFMAHQYLLCQPDVGSTKVVFNGWLTVSLAYIMFSRLITSPRISI